jgi:cation diffusion facilitator family transporter
VKRGIVVGLLANGLLLALKAAATGLSDSLTIFSETLNSLSDFLGAIVILVFVLWAHRSDDDDHPFGHGRAEPIAGLTLGIFAGILGVEVLRHAFLHLSTRQSPEHIGPFPALALVITIAVKAGLCVYFRRLGKTVSSPAFRASAIDCRNDVLVGSQALAGVLLASANLGIFDGISALLVGIYILYSAFGVARENIDFLMGKAPDSSIHEQICRAADGVPQVAEIDNVKAHYVGTQVHVELTARVSHDLSTAQSHDIAEEVREAVESIPHVQRAFIHIEPTNSERMTSYRA